MLFLEVVLGYHHFDGSVIRAGGGVDCTKVGARSRLLQDPIQRFRSGRTRSQRGGECRRDAHGFVASPAANAALTHLINVGASNGLDRKQTAPSRNACRRADSSGNAVTNMNGTSFPCLRRVLCSSTPLMSGIRTSVITHDDSFNCGDRKNSAADTKVQTAYPRALRRLSVAARMDASSSTTEITGRLG